MIMSYLTSIKHIKIKISILSIIFLLLFFSCRRMKDEECYTPIIIDSLKCQTNIKDTTQFYTIDSVKFTISFYYHLSPNRDRGCMPLTYTTDYYTKIFILTNNQFCQFNPNDTINSICGDVIYYRPVNYFYKGKYYYLYNETSFTFDKMYFYNVDEILLQNEGNPPCGIVQFKIKCNPNSVSRLHLKCIIELKSGKLLTHNFKHVKIIP